MSEKRSLLDILRYRYRPVDEVEKDGKVYKKYKRVPRFGGAVIWILQAGKIALVAVAAILVSYILINAVFNERKPAGQVALR